MCCLSDWISLSLTCIYNVTSLSSCLKLIISLLFIYNYALNSRICLSLFPCAVFMNYCTSSISLLDDASCSAKVRCSSSFSTRYLSASSCASLISCCRCSMLLPDSACCLCFSSSCLCLSTASLHAFRSSISFASCSIRSFSTRSVWIKPAISARSPAASALTRSNSPLSRSFAASTSSSCLYSSLCCREPDSVSCSFDF